LIKVEFLGPIGKAALELEIDNLNELAAILQEDNEVKDWLQSCAVAVNDTLVSSLEMTLKDGDRVSLLPPVCGG
jgi:molybdopterin synthase sulfur carrier subunit